MAEAIFEIGIRLPLELFGCVVIESIRSCRRHRQSKTLISSDLSILLKIKHERAKLIGSSNITFGNDCERLVNIAFKTSQTFSHMMGTYADVTCYLREELDQRYPNEYFHIIISENESLGFSVDFTEYFAEIEQVQYRVVIFSTGRNSQRKLNTHDADSQMLFIWN